MIDTDVVDHVDGVAVGAIGCQGGSGPDGDRRWRGRRTQPSTVTVVVGGEPDLEARDAGSSVTGTRRRATPARPLAAGLVGRHRLEAPEPVDELRAIPHIDAVDAGAADADAEVAVGRPGPGGGCVGRDLDLDHRRRRAGSSGTPRRVPVSARSVSTSGASQPGSTVASLFTRAMKSASPRRRRPRLHAAREPGVHGAGNDLAPPGTRARPIA